MWSKSGSYVRGMALVAAGVSTSAASGQCTRDWQVTSGLAVQPHVLSVATAWDPDGAGPAEAVLVAAGTFDPSSVIAAWDGTSWSPLGTGTFTWFGFAGLLHCMAVLPNGDLIVGGLFDEIGGVSASNLARWDGTTWSEFAPGLDNEVLDLLVLANGDVIAVGVFDNAGATFTPTIARWDGTSWSSVGGGLGFGFFDVILNSVIELPNGDLMVAGDFTEFLSGNSARNVARWDGTSWHAVGVGLNDWTLELALLPNGDVVAGGFFESLGDGSTTAQHLAVWDGTSWAEFGGGVHDGHPGEGRVGHLDVLSNGDLLVGGRFRTAGSVESHYVARWDGAGWVEWESQLDVADPFSYPHDVQASAEMPNGDLYVLGDIEFLVDGVPSPYVVKYACAACPADLNGDGAANNTDINLFVSAFLAMDPAVDLNADGAWNNTDVNLFVSQFLAGCN